MKIAVSSEWHLKRRLDASRLFHKTPYDAFGVRDLLLLESVLEQQFSEISDSIKIKVYLQRIEVYLEMLSIIDPGKFPKVNGEDLY